MEMADLIVITKADEKNRSLANQSKIEFLNAIKLFHHPLEKWKVPVEICSSLENYNIDKIWNLTLSYFEFLNSHQYLPIIRNQKKRNWFLHELEKIILSTLTHWPEFQEQVSMIETMINENKILHFEGLKKIQDWLSHKITHSSSFFNNG
jgi:LAO/AO transport system kinase